MIVPAILCGGSGTRLWPLSRKSYPKQFVPLIDGKSLLQLTLERLAGIGESVLCIASEEHRFLVLEAMQAAQINGAVILEPVGRNTAAAMACGGLQALKNAETGDDPLLLFCPADHHIPDAVAFAKMVYAGVPAAQSGAFVTFGVVPSFPSTAYGYIQQGSMRVDGSREVAAFIEKPNAERAQFLILQGDVLWNAGIFLVSAKTLIAALQQDAPDILASCIEAMQGSSSEALSGVAFQRPDATAFTQCRSQSVDYAVLEHHKNVAVVPFAGSWSDVGSWNAVADLKPADAQGNRLDGDGMAHALHSTNTFIYAPHRPVVALGTQDLLIIDTPDALLVANSSYAEAVKEVVSELDRLQLPQAVMHRKVARPWGWYDSLDLGVRHQVKRIGIKPGAALSLQKHRQRAEHWIVVKGTAEVTRGSEIFTLTENQSIYIPLGEVHRLRNTTDAEVEIIEVQSGSYLGEDDIVRLEDTYGRN